MKRYVMTVFVLLLALSVVSFAQDMKKEMKKDEMKKDDKMGMTKDEGKMGPLKSFTCDPSCGFCVKSHDEGELMSMAKSHSKKHHNMTMSDKDVKGMMKEEKMDMKKDDSMKK